MCLRGLLPGLLYTFLTAAASAQPAHLVFKQFTQSEGLPDYTIQAVTRDQAGFLWIGTQKGLNRYDGARFSNMSEQADWHLGDSHILTLVADPSDPMAVWGNTLTGELFKADGHGNITPFAFTFEAQTLLAEEGGGLWVGSRATGLYRYDPVQERFEVYRASGAPGALASDSVITLCLPRSDPGKLWIGTANGVSVLDLAMHRFTNYQIPVEEAPGYREVTGIAEVGGQLWIGTRAGTLYRFDSQARRLVALAPRPSFRNITTLTPSRFYEDVLWIGTRGLGLFALNTRSGRTLQFAHQADEPTSLSSNEVLSVIEDEQQALWIGTFSNLNQAILRAPRFTPHRLPDAGPAAGGGVLGLYEAPSEPGMVWVGTIRRGLLRYNRRTGQYTTLFSDREHPLNLAFAFHEARDGMLWIGTDKPALYGLDRTTGHVELLPLSSTPEAWVKQYYEMPSRPGMLWISTRGLGLLKFDPQRRVILARYSDDENATFRFPTHHLWKAYEASWAPGILWIGTHGEGLLRLDTQTNAVTIYGPTASRGTCLPSTRIVSIASTETGVLWLGTFDAGLVRFDTRTEACRTYTPAEGLAHVDVGAILPDSQGRLWLTTSNGLSVFDPIHEAFTTFTREDGLHGNTFYYFASALSAENEFLLGGDGGFNLFHPDSLVLRMPPPNVVLTSVRVDGQPFPLGQTRPLHLRYNQNDLAFEFAALDLREPKKNQYRVQLVGADTTWQAIGNQTAIRYPHLAPGRYTFRVIGSNSDGYWNTEGAHVHFTIAVPYWRAWWFWSLMAAGALALAAAAYRYRVAQLLQMERLRLKIAHDLHDEVGANLSAIALQTEMLRLTSTNGQGEQIGKISQLARSTATTLREIVWLVNADYDTLPKLAQKMEDTMSALLEGSGLRYTFEKPETLPKLPLSMEFRQNVLFLFKEMLQNVVKHAQARRVVVRIGTEQGHFRLQVSDDGRGFDPATVKPGNGFASMQRRAMLLAGTLRLESAPGNGSTATFDIPLPRKMARTREAK